MTDSFFLPGMCNDKAYLNLRDLPPELSEEGRRLLTEARNFIEELWREFKPFADKHFQKDAQNHFIQRFWEMYLGVALIRQGYHLRKPRDEGPEFFFWLNNKKVWVEAIAPGPGEGPDAVPEYKPVVDPRDIIAISVPEEKILLRFTNALVEKVKKYERDLKKDFIISPCDHYVLAINGRRIPHAPYGGALPYILNAILGIGHPAVVLDRIKGDIVDSYFERREYVSKISGATVSTAKFLDSNYSSVSGVLYSSVDPVNRPKKMGGDFIFIHNPLAKNPIARVFGWCRQYWLDGEELHVLESNPSLNADTPDQNVG